MKKLRLVIPKGRIHKKVIELLEDAGIKIEADDRTYRPIVNDSDLYVKIMKPQNIPELVSIGAHDAGFTGYDWILETRADVVELFDTGFDPVRIVAAIPLDKTWEELRSRKIIAASEYENITKKFLEDEKIDYIFIRTYGATEVFPPEDADLIVDNSSTGRTLEMNRLKIVKELFRSSTRFIANKNALKDSWKKEKIEEMIMLFKSVLNARERVMLEMNVPKDRFEEIVKILPCMRAPTVAPLYGDQGYAIKVAVKKDEVRSLIPLLKKLGATDILEYELRKVIA